jgi:hypothetical protein
MKKPLIDVRLKLWSDFETFRKSVSVVYKLIYPALRTKGVMSARGAYTLHDKTVHLFLDEIYATVLGSFNIVDPESATDNNVKISFICQFYYTFVHELIHHCKVQKGHTAEGAHQLDLPRYEKLPLWLKILFDDYIEMEKRFTK